MQRLLGLALLLGLVVLVIATRPPYCGIDLENPPINPIFSPVPSGYRLIQVNALIRHGDRLPLDKCWDNDAVWDCDLEIEERSTSSNGAFANISRLHRKRYIKGAEIFPGQCMAGQLTRYGYNQHLVNGANLRDQYVLSGFLPRQFDSRSTYLRSTDVPRTLQSAQALLKALYPWNNGSSATEFVDVYTVDEAREYLYPNPWSCSKLEHYETAAKSSGEYLNFLKNVVNPLMGQIAHYYALNPSKMPVPVAVFDCLAAHKCHNMAIPTGLPDALYDKLVQAMEWEYRFIYNFPSRIEYGQLAMGQLYNEIYNKMTDALHGLTTQNRFNLYSAHDTSVMPFLNAIGAWDGIWAPYASIVQMELYTPSNADQEPLIRWIYNRKELILPECSSSFCPFSSFIKMIEPLIRFKNHEQACFVYSRPHNTKLGVYTHDGA